MSRPNAIIGQVVLWFPNADRAYKPAPAIVTGTDGRGCLTLAVILPNSREFWIASGARHLSDPYHNISPDVSKDSGGWSTPQEYASGRNLAPASNLEAAFGDDELADRKQRSGQKAQATDDEVLTILQLHEEELTNSEIAERLGNGWNPQRVYHVIQKHGQPANA